MKIDITADDLSSCLDQADAALRRARAEYRETLISGDFHAAVAAKEREICAAILAERARLLLEEGR